MSVTHCQCENLSFEQVLAWAKARGATTVTEIAEGLGCSTHCGLCAPFLAYALATGQTDVPFPCPPLPARRRTGGPPSRT